jgi:hypothetical protein
VKGVYRGRLATYSGDVFSTADLPESMRADQVDAHLLRAVRASHLRLDAPRCDHGRYDCAPCVIEAARRLVEAAGAPAPA